MPSPLERHREVIREGRGPSRHSEIDDLRAEVTALREALEAKGVVSAAEVAAARGKGRPRAT